VAFTLGIYFQRLSWNIGLVKKNAHPKDKKSNNNRQHRKSVEKSEHKPARRVRGFVGSGFTADTADGVKGKAERPLIPSAGDATLSAKTKPKPPKRRGFRGWPGGHGALMPL
jgi:hypothetical protein